MTENIKKIGIAELRTIVKEAVEDFQKKSAAQKKVDDKKNKEKGNLKESTTVKITTEQLRNMVKEAVQKKLKESMENLGSDSPSPSSPTPKKGDKVLLASGKAATVAEVDPAKQMVFITIDGVKMIGVPMDYVSVADSSPDELANFAPTSAPPEKKEERVEQLKKMLSRGFLDKNTRRKLEAELESLVGSSEI